MDLQNLQSSQSPLFFLVVAGVYLFYYNRIFQISNWQDHHAIHYICLCLIFLFPSVVIKFYCFSITNSTKTPLVLFGCKKATNLLSAPCFGVSFIKINPSLISRFISASISSTSKAMW